MPLAVLPAYAGMIPWPIPRHLFDFRAPRVCGDDPTVRRPLWILATVLPAYAGMIPPSRDQPLSDLSAPRVCGDDPSAGSSCLMRLRCSPRMRG